MNDESAVEHEQVLSLWFGSLDEHGRADEAHSKRWFVKDTVFDQTLCDRFGALHTAIAKGERESWLESPRSCLAYVVVLDQFSRNMFRASPRMFAHDAQALGAAEGAVARGWDRSAAFDERGFFYMPFMHSERLADQDRCVALFTEFRDEVTGAARERVDFSLGYAERHRVIVARFGRFPHRNALLGRTSTPEEIEFLKQPGSSSF